jgi:hypothetical protein
MRNNLRDRRENGGSRPATTDELAASYELGELAAALEITLPIASARNNALAALNFLDQQPPDLGAVREALGCLVGDLGRAGDTVDRIREHIKNAPPRNERPDLNAAIDEVIALARNAITENGVSAGWTADATEIVGTLR